VKVTFVYRYLSLGGVEVVLASRLSLLSRLGIESSLWFLSDGPGRNLFLGGDPAVHVGGLPELWGHLGSTRPDLVSIIDTPEAFDAVRSEPRPPRVILEVHTPYPDSRVYLRGPECRVARAVFVPSEHQKRVVRREMVHAPPIVVVPNPIGAAFEAPLDDVVVEGVPPILAWIGRLDRLKDWRRFLLVASRVIHECPKVEAWVIGAGSDDEEREFLRRGERGELRGRLRWLRGVRPAVMPRLLDCVRASGGVVMSTSRGESFGMAIAEAMARGCAVAVPDREAFPEFISPGRDGLLFPHGKTRHAADQVCMLLSSAEARRELGKNARTRIIQSHGAEVSSRALGQALAQVAASDL
jgi:glycosyltransferase involved in cell wall biosynthesis